MPDLIREIPPQATHDLRSRILRPGRPLSECVYAGDEKGIHFGAFSSGRLVSVISASPEDHPLFSIQGQWRIRGMATATEAQGKGFGMAVLNALLARAREKEIPLLWCNAREKAISFYERAGFRVESEFFDIPGIGPHKVMRIDL